jgi:TonB family protein
MKLPALALAALLLIPSPGRAAEDSLSAAKELYAAAAYEDALAMFGKLAESANPAIAAQIDEYRAFCLYALGRTQEAESVAQGLLRRNPLYKPQGEDISPRVEAMLTQVRKQVLPGLIREKYRSAKAAVDKKDFVEAEPQLVMLREMIASAEKLGIKDESVTDLGVLAEGFLDLARAAIASAATPTKTATPAAAATDAVNAASKSEAPSAPRVFDATSTGVVQPIAIRQSLPSPPAALAKMLVGKRGILEVTIDADGKVSDAIMRDSVSSTYDTMVINATKMWRYKPATKDGVPVRFVKEIGVEIHQNE